MINIYKYTFYRMYIWQFKKFGAMDVPAYKAVLIVSILASWNIATVGLLLRALGFIKIDVLDLPKQILLLLWLGVLTFLYFSFVYHDKYKAIEAEYKKETRNERNINSILVLIYVIASFYVNIII